jgi:membrane-bound lytic murein transglycosylase B
VFIGALATLLVACSSEPDGGSAASTAVINATSTSTGAAIATTLSATTTTTASTTRITGELTATDVATELTSIERAAAAGDAGVGVRQQLLYRYLAAHADLDEAVIPSVADDVRPYVERIIRARQLGQALQAADATPSPPSKTLPAWNVVDPLPADELLGYYREAQAATGIAWYWLAAIHLQETRMGRIIGTSSAGAVGPMQFLPETWDRCCAGDPLAPRDAIIGAATYLVKGGGPADMPAALNEYNPNTTYVATVTAFAENMRDNPKIYAAYHEWQVFYGSSAGTVRLPVGYSEAGAIDAATYLVSHPGDAG